MAVELRRTTRIDLLDVVALPPPTSRPSTSSPSPRRRGNLATRNVTLINTSFDDMRTVASIFLITRPLSILGCGSIPSLPHRHFPLRILLGPLATRILLRRRKRTQGAKAPTPRGPVQIIILDAFLQRAPFRRLPLRRRQRSTGGPSSCAILFTTTRHEHRFRVAGGGRIGP